MNNDNCSVAANRAPIIGAPGAHPLGSGIGAVVGGLAAKDAAEANWNRIGQSSWLCA